MKIEKKICALAAATIAGVSGLAAPTTASAQEPMLGEILVFAGNFCPRGYRLANGDLIDIADNQSLYSILGTMYGGDGRNNFALPDLQGRVMLGIGMGPGLSNYVNGGRGGSESTTPTVAQMPSHAHGIPDTAAAETAFVKEEKADKGVEVVKSIGATAASTQSAGGGQSHDNRQPYLAMQICIAVEGVYPTRN